MITSIVAKDDWILTGSNDHYAKFWDIRKKKTFSFEHKDSVTDVMFFNGFGVSGSVDRTVRIWN